MPQHAKRIKIRRKALRQPDEFETLTGQAVNWASANRGLVTGVVAALAHAKEATGETTPALEAYVQAGTLEGPYRTDALLSAARLHEAGGRADLAREIYARLLKEAPEPDLKAFLLSKLPPGQQATAPAKDEGVAPDAAAAAE